MEAFDIYKDIASRTGGDIYIGVVGPVRTGKSTFITQMMEKLVLPNIDDVNTKERVTDELPQSGSGRTIMTTQPKFVPGQAVTINIDDKASFRIRMVDCVGYLIDGAMGHEEQGAARMVRTPWFDYDIPFEQAAEIGTKKVIDEHATIGIVMTTDGSIADIPRENYVTAEERVVMELKALGKPFIIVLNSSKPESAQAKALQEELQGKYNAPVLLMNVMNFSLGEMNQMLADLLYEFPIKQINVGVSGWVCALGADHWLLSDIISKIKDGTNKMAVMRDFSDIEKVFGDSDYIKEAGVESIYLGSGTINLSVEIEGSLFYKVLGEECGYVIRDDSHLVKLVKELASSKHEYDRVASALKSVRSTGYGIVPPEMTELALEEPEIVQQAGKFGVRLKASAPSLHIIKVDVQTEVSRTKMNIDFKYEKSEFRYEVDVCLVA